MRRPIKVTIISYDDMAKNMSDEMKDKDVQSLHAIRAKYDKYFAQIAHEVITHIRESFEENT